MTVAPDSRLGAGRYLAAGQGTPSVNNDLALVHERALIDLAAGLGFLRERGFGSIVGLGHSGGGTLSAYYAEQAGLVPTERAPGVRPSPLTEAELPPPDGTEFVLEFSGDQAAFPRDARRMRETLGATDRTEVDVRGTHVGGPIARDEPTGNELAGREIRRWLSERFALVRTS